MTIVIWNKGNKYNISLTWVLKQRPVPELPISYVYYVLQGIGQLVEDFSRKKAQIVFINIQVTAIIIR